MIKIVLDDGMSVKYSPSRSSEIFKRKKRSGKAKRKEDGE